MSIKLEYVKHLIDDDNFVIEETSDGIIMIKIFSDYQNVSEFFKKISLMIDREIIEKKLDKYLSKGEYEVIVN